MHAVTRPRRRRGSDEGMLLRAELLVNELFIMIKFQLYFSMFKKRPVFMREYKNKTQMIGRIWERKFNCVLEDSFTHWSLFSKDKIRESFERGLSPGGFWHFWAVFKNKEAMSLPDPCCVPEFIDATVCQLPLGFWQGRRLGSCHGWSFWSPELDQRQNSGLLSRTETQIVLVSFVHFFITF